MKKGYYLYTENCGSCGVDSKISMQIAEFSKHMKIEGLQIVLKKRTVLQKIWNVSLFGSIGWDYQKVFEQLVAPDFIYMRRTYADRTYINFLRVIREKYPSCKIIIEIPTYPYDGEMCSYWYTFLIFFKEWYYRRKYCKYIDRFVTYSDDKRIFDVPTICTMNGIDTDKVSVEGELEEYNPENINMLAVALFAPHHGYERVIYGMRLYYKENSVRKVFLHLVGNGSEVKRYRKLVNKFGLNDYVIFYGEKKGAELDKLYKIADVGLAAFGVYKDGISKITTLKAREYIAKGLPVILGAEDKMFNDCEYGLTCPNDSSAIDIKKIVAFTDELYVNKRKADVACEIRKFAKNNADNRITLRPIIEYILSDSV